MSLGHRGQVVASVVLLFAALFLGFPGLSLRGLTVNAVDPS